MFERTTSTIVEGAQFLETLVRTSPISTCVSCPEGDRARRRRDQHETYEKLNKTFLTPFDREDLHNLASQLDEILDWIEEAGHSRLLQDRRDAPRGFPAGQDHRPGHGRLDAAIRQLRSH